jgi:transcriptional regulator with XRE-family HTH domain
MKTGLIIKELRVKKGMTQEELAQKTELSARTIQRIENGEVDPRAYTLQMIAKALEVDFSLFAEEASDTEKELDIDSKRTWLAIIHLSGILPLFFPTIIIWNRKKAEIKEMTEHYRAVIAFQSMILFMGVLILWGNIHTGMIEPFYGFLFISVLFPVWNALKVLNDKPYKYFGLFQPKKTV